MVLFDSIDSEARKDPSRIAFSCLDEHLTYGELATRSNQLAQFLVCNGIRHGERIGIYMPRCIEAATAIYGILKAGAVFVPIDPTVPAAAFHNLIEQCDIRGIVTQRQMCNSVQNHRDFLASLEFVVGVEVGDLSNKLSWSAVFNYCDSPPRVSVQPTDNAYIMFTSGSTGHPKGITHTHASGLGYARLSTHTYSIDRNDVIGSHAPLHTDMSTLGFLSGPFAGARTVIVPEAHTRMPASLAQLIAQSGISIWYSVPLALVQLLTRGAMEKHDFSSLRWVLYGGEPVSPKYLQNLAIRLPFARISNVYGPAEVNQCTYYHLPDNWHISWPTDSNKQIPIGHVWPETKALVLDDRDIPVVSGEAGELMIHSTTMMRGYWKRPDLDNTSFYSHGYTNERYYRTGDMVRELPDVGFVLVGRKDRQIKVRGIRVELDAIELILSQHERIEDIAAYPVRDPADDTKSIHVAATVVDNGLTEAEIDEFARSRLPDAAVPMRISILDKLPRTTSGKIDRTALSRLAETCAS